MPALGALIHIVLPSFLYSLEVLHLLRVLASDGVMDLGARGGCKEQEEDMGHDAHPVKAMSQG
jgi:hypothetical protein